MHACSVSVDIGICMFTLIGLVMVMDIDLVTHAKKSPSIWRDWLLPGSCGSVVRALDFQTLILSLIPVEVGHSSSLSLA